MEEGEDEVTAKLYVMSDNEPNTLNTSTDGEFSCLICEHFTMFAGEIEWSETSRRLGGYTHMRGTEPFHFCPNCGREILSRERWDELHQEDRGKTFREIGERFI